MLLATLSLKFSHISQLCTSPTNKNAARFSVHNKIIYIYNNFQFLHYYKWHSTAIKGYFENETFELFLGFTCVSNVNFFFTMLVLFRTIIIIDTAVAALCIYTLDKIDINLKSNTKRNTNEMIFQLQKIRLATSLCAVLVVLFFSKSIILSI